MGCVTGADDSVRDRAREAIRSIGETSGAGGPVGPGVRAGPVGADNQAGRDAQREDRRYTWKAFTPAISRPTTQNRKVMRLLEIVTDQINQYRPTASHPAPIAICTRVPVGDMRHNLARLSRCGCCGGV
jgi:hypothetical protein